MTEERTSWAVRTNRWALTWSRNYLKVMLVFLSVFIFLPFAAPLAMQAGLTGVGDALYRMYSPLCHQFAFRSWFVFGEQAAYPRQIANVPGLQTFDSLFGQVVQTVGQNPPANTPLNPDEWYAREFKGNPQMGYKVAICQRDVGIYAGLLIAGLIFAIPVVRRHVRPVPILLYILLGIVPIGIDGFSQLLSGRFWPPRESTPAFRAITGLLFGLMNGWLAYPYLEATAREAIAEIQAKFGAGFGVRAARTPSELPSEGE